MTAVPVDRFFLDTAVLALAVGGEHPLREASRRYLEAAARGTAELHISVEAVQELMFHRLRRGDSRTEVVSLATTVRDTCILHPFDVAVLDRALELVATSSLGGRDAIHAATAVGAGFAEIITIDRDFDDVPGLRRREPGTT